jgi:hypothetical protein
MIATELANGAFPLPSLDGREGEGLVELMLLVPRLEAATLEEAAHQQGLTVGQMMRRLIREYTSRQKFARRFS